jgi:type I site-specific restriction endonuclease
MQHLNFPEYPFHLVDKDGKLSVFDPVRKKYVALTPEEWVRQHVVHYLVNEKNVPLSLIRIEAEIKLYKTKKRFDIAVFDRNGNPLLLVECKAPSVSLSQAVLDQAARYNITMKVSFLMLTNGLQHVVCRIDPETGAVMEIEELPAYPFPA